MKTLKIKRLKVLIAITLFVTILSACGNEATSVDNQNQPLIILQGVDATSLDPAMHSDTPSSNVEYQIFDTLIKRSSDMHLKPSIANSWKMINDTTWKLTIRDDVKFHNGETLTAEDVKFSIERIIDPKNKSPRMSHYNIIKDVILEENNSIIIKTKQPYPVLLSRLSDLRIVPKKYLQEVGNEQFAVKPIGSGPYKLKEWQRDEFINLVAYEQYWDGCPEIKEVVFKPVPESSARVMSLRAKEADIITNLPPHQVTELKQSAGVDSVSVDSTRVMFMSITTNRKNVKDIRVRQALNYAIDKQSIINNILEKSAVKSDQIISKFDLGFNNNLTEIDYNPQKAKQLLKDAGYEKGLKITMKSPSGRYLMDKEVAEAVKLQLEAVGIEVELTFEEFGTYVTKIISGTMDADVWLIGWGSSTFDAGTTLKQWLYTPNKTAYYRVSKETNNHIDSLLEEALMTMEEVRRAEIYYDIIQQVHNDSAFINLYQQKDLYGVSDRVKFSPRSDELIDVKSIKWKK
ncbi:ABC transporter substrate-binding protein [Clostridium sp. 'deep sea']|uniref:ABC transporter substrate-binding protein n=1 Tax=Clostridium sp. 'deep sea' TaxID=2779445 RepID=UPI00189667DF|nr:ABC transporter substrate-binding protein [Clostridium sp. 'deep sea']QOR34053.1 ABC transporter substrate-binding protein [Clostridium sp. 'deep sea']